MDVVIVLYKCIFYRPLGLYNKTKPVNNGSYYILVVVLKPIALRGSFILIKLCMYLLWLSRDIF